MAAAVLPALVLPLHEQGVPPVIVARHQHTQQVVLVQVRQLAAAVLEERIAPIMDGMVVTMDIVAVAQRLAPMAMVPMPMALRLLQHRRLLVQLLSSPRLW